MARSVLLLFVGALAGGAAILSFFRPAAPIDSPAIPQVSEVSPATNPGVVTAVRVAAYRQAVQATDAIDLESMLDFTAAQPRSRARDLELKALLGRLSEIDPRRAVDFAQSAYLETRLLAEAFEALARADADAAIIELASVTPAPRQRKIALAVLEVIGNDVQGVARLAAALPVEDEASFEIDALLARAEADPLGAFQETVRLERATLQSLILPRLAEVIARRDAKGALALAASIEDSDMRRNFQLSVLNAWGETNPDGVFEFLATAEPGLLAASSTIFRAVARSDPDRLLAMLDRFPPAARINAKRAAMQAVAERDPVDAIAMLDTFPPGRERESMVTVIAQAYGRENPDLALAWVESLSPPSDNAMRAVLQGIAQTDVDRAIAIVMAELDESVGSGPDANQNSIVSSLSFSMMMSMMPGDAAGVSRIADRLLVADNPQVRSMMSSVVSMWAQRDSEAALNWTLANAEQLEDSTLRNLSQRIADEDLDLAISTLDGLAPDKRAGWIEGLAARLVQRDVNEAIGFLERYRGQPGYDQAYGTFLSQIARNDPVRAAGMLATAPESSANGSAIFAISREWANRDPAAAGRWAVDSIDDAQLQSTAIVQIASTWAQRDAAAAERWIFSLTSGQSRDAAVNGYLTAAAQVGQFEPHLLDAYSSNAVAQQGASNAIVQIGRTDPEQAERLLELYITDPAVRSEAADSLARSSNRGGVVISDGNVIFLN